MGKEAALELFNGSKEQLYCYLKRLDDSFSPALSSYVDLEKFSKKLTDNALIYTVNASNNQFAGLFAAYINDIETKITYLTSIAILKQYQGLGYAQLLMNKLVEESQTAGMIGIKLEVYKDNEQAIRFYKRNNFIEITEAIKENTFYMYKSLLKK